MRLHLFLLFLVAQLSSSCQSEVKLPSLEEIESIDELLRTFVDDELTHSVSLATIDNGQITFYNATDKSLDQDLLPDSSSIYEIGSITKTFTTTLLSQMVLDSSLTLDDTIDKYLSADLNWNENEDITLKDLATHQSGLPRLTGTMKFQAFASMKNPYQLYSQDDFIKDIKEHKPVPRTERSVDYSNYGMALLGRILELHSGMSYEDLVTEKIFKPLGMDSTFVYRNGRKTIQGYDSNLEATPNWDLDAAPGMGGIKSSTADMVKYLEFQLGEEPAVLATHELQQKLSDRQSIGLGWFHNHYPDEEKRISWHNGGTGGFKTIMAFNKKTNKGVVVLSNSTTSVDLLGIRALQFLDK